MSEISSSVSTARPGRAWRTSVFAFYALMGLALAAWLARIPAVRDDLHLQVDEMGIVIFTVAIGSIIGLAVSGPTIQRIGARRSMTLSIVGDGVGLVIVGVASSYVHSVPLTVCGLVILGFSVGFGDVVANVEGADAERAYGKTLLPRLHAGYSLGGVLGAAVGAGTAALGLSVAAFFIGIAVVVVIVGFIALRGIPERETLNDTPETEGGSWIDRIRASLQVWRDPRLILIGIVLLAFAFAEGSATDWITIASVDGHGLDQTGAAIFYGIFMAATTLMRFFGGPILDRWGRVAVLRWSAVVTIVGILLFVLVPDPVVSVIALILWAIGIAFGFPSSITAASEGPNPTQRVSAAAMMGYVAFLAGPPALGFLGQHAGILTVFIPAAVLLAAVLFIIGAVRERRVP